MHITLTIDNDVVHADLGEPISLAIPLDFSGEQPNHFSAPRAAAAAFEADGFVGDTTRGGFCNVAELRLIPHCNGTHTETVSHIVDQMVTVADTIRDALIPATLLTVEPLAAASVDEIYRPNLLDADRVITARQLESQLSATTPSRRVALVLRMLPNDPAKRSRVYGADRQAPFLTVDAMEYVVRSGVRHLLVDFPSVDRMYDEGKLTNHHIFWNVEEGSSTLTAEAHAERTITEMIYVPQEVPDGPYLLNLQVPAFLSDAVPSRPMLYRLTQP